MKDQEIRERLLNNGTVTHGVEPARPPQRFNFFEGRPDYSNASMNPHPQGEWVRWTAVAHHYGVTGASKEK